MSDPNFGDIAGLHELAATTQKTAPEFATAGHVLDTQVQDLTSDAWTGQAARAFSAAWGKDSAGASAISEALGHISGTVGQLASALEEAKKQYDNAVQTAKEHNIPLAGPGQTITVPANVKAQSEQLSAQANSAVQLADVARKQAAAQLGPLTAALDPNAAKMGPTTPQEAAELAKLGLGDYVKISAAAGDLYAAPAVATLIQKDRVATLEQAYVQAKNAYSLAGGKSAKASVYQELKAAKKDALGQLKAARGELSDAEALADRFPGSRAAATNLEGALESAGKDISNLKILKAAPLIDVAATGYNIYDDVHNHGWSVPSAVVADSADTLAGVGATAGVIALAPEAAPVVAVAGVGVAVGYEATEAATALTHDAHWGANIQKYGVVVGVGHSFVDAGSAFVKSNVEMADKVGSTVASAATSVWHGITNLF